MLLFWLASFMAKTLTDTALQCFPFVLNLQESYLMRPCISIRGDVRPSVRRSVGPSVRQSVICLFLQQWICLKFINLLHPLLLPLLLVVLFLLGCVVVRLEHVFLTWPRHLALTAYGYCFCEEFARRVLYVFFREDGLSVEGVRGQSLQGLVPISAIIWSAVHRETQESNVLYFMLGGIAVRLNCDVLYF